VNRRWLVARRDLGLEHVTFHGLRHFHATLLLDRGVAVMDVAAQLGHSDNGELVRATYGHPDVGAALERVASIAGGHDACGA
jgi:integrase